jgi:hypothetical protein
MKDQIKKSSTEFFKVRSKEDKLYVDIKYGEFEIRNIKMDKDNRSDF